MSADTLETAVGTADVLHRLALGLECLDAVSGRRLRTAIRAGCEVDRRLLARGHDPRWPCLSLEGKGIGRFQVRLGPTTPTTVRVRLVDPARRVVARRFDLPLWTLEEVRAAEAAGTPVRAASRTLRPWLWPGPAAGLPRGATVVRGAVRSAAGPVRWARLTAVRPGDGPVGHGQADDRGEFVLLITDTGSMPPPAPSELDVELVVTGPDPAGPPPPDPADPFADLLADLPVEALGRPSDPPQPGETDNDVLRGIATPVGHVPNTAPAPTLTVPVGGELTLTQAIPFAA